MDERTTPQESASSCYKAFPGNDFGTAQPMRNLIYWLLGVVLIGGCGKSPFTGTTMKTPAGHQSAEPNLARGRDGTIVLSWLEDDATGSALRYSVLSTAGWQAARTIAVGDNWFVNWADFPSVVPISPELWAAHWLVMSSDGTYSYDVAIALSQDGGQSWSESITPHTDGTKTEHGFVSLFPWQDGVGALWLDGRNMAADDAATDHGAGGMTLRSAVVTADRLVASDQLVDELVCDCCQTDVAIGPRGPIAVYRNRTADETRDIYVAPATDGRWQPGKTINNDQWTIAGCPVNGPAIAADGTNVVVAWFTAADDRSRVRLARSSDGAETFGEPVDIHVRRPLGRVDVELLDNGDAVVSWLARSAPKQAELCLRRVPAGSKPGPVHVVARTTAGRLSGVPQMVRDGQHLILAWTDAGKNGSRVLTSRVNTAMLMTNNQDIHD